MFSLLDYDYRLPESRIAQKPAESRDRSRLLRLNRTTGEISHHQFRDMGAFLSPGDVLVLNNTKVIPGRLLGRKETGGKAEILILDFAQARCDRIQSGRWICTCLLNASKATRPGAVIHFDEGLEGKVLEVKDGFHRLELTCSGDFECVLDRVGKVPLPPYIKRNGTPPPGDDSTSYQTVYASEKGAIAAPTAGLHFSGDLLEELKERGIRIVEITLHVGYGTFLPVREPDIRNHRIHSEWYHVSQQAADAINAARKAGGKIAAVGTTCVRTLEFSSGSDGRVVPGSGRCDLFIYPGYRFKAVDAMITNFHLPKSTLLMLVCAFADRENIFRAYRDAIERQYRFYSYGDAMLIE